MNDKPYCYAVYLGPQTAAVRPVQTSLTTLARLMNRRVA
jgi:hypothetical protein